MTRANATGYKSIGMLYRYLEIASYYRTMDGLERARFSHPRVNYRHVIAPTVTLPSTWYPLSLNSSDINTIINQGYEDTSDALTKGRTNIEDHIEFYKLKKAAVEEPISFEAFVEAKRQPSFLKAQ